MFDAPKACPRDFRPRFSAWAWGLSTPSSASVAIIERPCSVRHSMFSPSPLGCGYYGLC